MGPTATLPFGGRVVCRLARRPEARRFLDPRWTGAVGRGTSLRHPTTSVKETHFLGLPAILWHTLREGRHTDDHGTVHRRTRPGPGRCPGEPAQGLSDGGGPHHPDG